jgi:ESF2/ABP1 family protein
LLVRLLFFGPVGSASELADFASPLTNATMARPSDSRFALSNEFGEIHTPGSLNPIPEHIIGDSESYSHADADPTSEREESIDGLGDGMDADGFAGPKVVKPLTQEALAAFRAAQEKAGVIYISRIPPGMQPAKVRHLMGQYGEVERVYLQKEGMTI